LELIHPESSFGSFGSSDLLELLTPFKEMINSTMILKHDELRSSNYLKLRLEYGMDDIF